MRFPIRSTLLASVSLATATAFAQPVQSQEIWHGWMNLTPCSKVEWNNNGVFGTPSPTVRTGPQELHGHLTMNLPTEQTVVDVARNCANKGVAAAGVAAVLTNWGAAWPTFKTTFEQCVKDSGKDILSSLITFRSDNICRY